MYGEAVEGCMASCNSSCEHISVENSKAIEKSFTLKLFESESGLQSILHGINTR